MANGGFPSGIMERGEEGDLSCQRFGFVDSLVRHVLGGGWTAVVGDRCDVESRGRQERSPKM